MDTRRLVTLLKKSDVRGFNALVDHEHLRWTRETGGKGKIPGPDLRGVDLSVCILREVRLTGANLEGAILRGTDLSFASLRGANLKGANLSVALLVDADLRDAELSGAILEAADIRGANFWGAQGLATNTRQRLMAELAMSWSKAN